MKKSMISLVLVLSLISTLAFPLTTLAVAEINDNIADVNFIHQGKSTCKATSLAMALNIIRGGDYYNTAGLGGDSCKNIDEREYEASNGIMYKATYCRDHSTIQLKEQEEKIREADNEGVPIVVAVRKTTSSGTKHHWVVALGYTSSGELKIVDPAANYATNSRKISNAVTTLSAAGYTLGLVCSDDTCGGIHYGFISFTPTTPVPRNLNGSVDVLKYSGNGEVEVSGWGFDSIDPTGTRELHFYLDGEAITGFINGVHRPDVQEKYPEAGGNTGFNKVIQTGIFSGNHHIGIYLIGSTPGDHILLYSGNLYFGDDQNTLKGSLDCIQYQGNGEVLFTGWGFDYIEPGVARSIHVYMDDELLTDFGTGVGRLDVQEKYPEAGENSGFARIIYTGRTSGTHSFKVYMIGSNQTEHILLYEGNLDFGERDSSLLGSVGDLKYQGHGKVLLTGWGFDYSSPGSRRDVHVYMDGELLAGITTGVLREDVQSRYPEAGSNSGFASVINAGTTSGVHTFKVYLIGSDTTEHALIYDGDVDFGNSESMLQGWAEQSEYIGHGRIKVMGWGFQYDEPEESLVLGFYLDDKVIDETGTGLAKPYVTAAYPEAGPNTGYEKIIEVNLPNGTYNLKTWLYTVGFTDLLLIGNRDIVVTDANHIVTTQETVTQQPTCTEAGIKTISEVCNNCGEVISSKTESVPATGHIATTLANSKEATCASAGYTGDRVCAACGEVIEAGTAIAMKKHAAAAAVKENETTAGYDSVVYCTNCHTEMTRTHVDTAVSETDPVIEVGTSKARAGETVTVAVSVKNNPGMNTFKLGIDYDQSAMTLTNVEGNSELGGNFVIEKKVIWLASKDSDYNGDILTLSFVLKEDVEAGNYPVSVSYSVGDICNYEEEDINFVVVAGGVNVISYIAGDINDDGAVNNKDLTRLMKYLAGANVTVCEMALDTNGDGSINNKDLTRLMKYLAGADVVIY